MKLAVLDRTFASALATPITEDNWMRVNDTLDGYLETRQVEWLYSLVSVNGDRSICVFQVPDIETVCEACCEAGMSFQRVWQADLWLDQDPTNLPQGCSLIIAEVNYAPPMTKAIYESGKQQAEGCFQELDVHHIFSGVSPDGTHSICAFLAVSAEHVRSLYRKIGQPFKQVWKATLVRPITTESMSSTVNRLGGYSLPVILNSQLPKYELPGLEHLTVAGPEQGTRSMEVWRQVIAPGVATPVHQHPCEEVIIFLTGTREVAIDGRTEVLNPETTLIVPPNVIHQIINTGQEPMHLVGILGMAPVRVYDADGQRIPLPWDAPDL